MNTNKHCRNITDNQLNWAFVVTMKAFPHVENAQFENFGSTSLSDSLLRQHIRSDTAMKFPQQWLFAISRSYSGKIFPTSLHL